MNSLGAQIASGSESEAWTSVRAAGVKTVGVNDAFLVAVEMHFADPTKDSRVGVFASTNTEPVDTVLLAVDSVAQEFTSWPHADRTVAGISQSDPGVAKAKACLK